MILGYLLFSFSILIFIALASLDTYICFESYGAGQSVYDI